MDPVTRRGANQSSRGKRAGKILFWCLMPLLFAGFVRFYSAIFNVLCGAWLALIFGERYLGAIFAMSLVTAALCSIGTCYILWKQYKRHILNNCQEK
jgi:hypothetical protein